MEYYTRLRPFLSLLIITYVTVVIHTSLYIASVNNASDPYKNYEDFISKSSLEFKSDLEFARENLKASPQNAKLFSLDLLKKVLETVYKTQNYELLFSPLAPYLSPIYISYNLLGIKYYGGKCNSLEECLDSDKAVNKVLRDPNVLTTIATNYIKRENAAYELLDIAR